MPSLKASRFKKIPFIGVLTLCMLASACTDSSVEPVSQKEVWQQKVAGEQLTDFLEFDLQLQLPLSDWPAIEQGVIPKTQDERWLILHQDGAINFYRSQSAKLIFQCSVEKQNEHVLVTSCRINQNPNILTLNSTAQAKSDLYELMSVLVGRSVR